MANLMTLERQLTGGNRPHQIRWSWFHDQQNSHVFVTSLLDTRVCDTETLRLAPSSADLIFSLDGPTGV